MNLGLKLIINFVGIPSLAELFSKQSVRWWEALPRTPHPCHSQKENPLSPRKKSNWPEIFHFSPRFLGCVLTCHQPVAETQALNYFSRITVKIIMILNYRSGRILSLFLSNVSLIANTMPNVNTGIIIFQRSIPKPEKKM